jgi:hypothetical protein
VSLSFSGRGAASVTGDEGDTSKFCIVDDNVGIVAIAVVVGNVVTGGRLRENVVPDALLILLILLLLRLGLRDCSGVSGAVVGAACNSVGGGCCCCCAGATNDDDDVDVVDTKLGCRANCN